MLRELDCEDCESAPATQRWDHDGYAAPTFLCAPCEIARIDHALAVREA